MENTNNKILTVSYMVLGVIAGIVMNVVVETLGAVATGPVSRIVSTDTFKHGVPVALGVLVFAVLQFNKNVNLFGDEVVTEIRRVVWPSRKDTTSMTTVVCIMLVVSGLAIGFMDMTAAYVIDWLLHINFGAIFG